MAHKRKIVTVFLLSAAAGCGTTSAPARDSKTAVTDMPVPVTAPAGTTAVAATSATIDPTPAPAPARPRPDGELPRALLELRYELYSKGAAAAVADPARFRALCDREGYPLVGNVANKGAMYTVVEHCATVRKAAQS